MVFYYIDPRIHLLGVIALIEIHGKRSLWHIFVNRVAQNQKVKKVDSVF
jgi:hypothetical protein